MSRSCVLGVWLYHVVNPLYNSHIMVKRTVNIAAPGRNICGKRMQSHTLTPPVGAVRGVTVHETVVYT